MYKLILGGRREKAYLDLVRYFIVELTILAGNLGELVDGHPPEICSELDKLTYTYLMVRPEFA